MMNQFGRVVLLFSALLLTACASTKSSQSEQIFDGVSLDGWEGDERFWRVEDGLIVGRTGSAGALTESTFLIWTGPPLQNFELRAVMRVVGSNNSGIQYRSARGEGYAVTGYQCDVHPRPEYNGMLYEQGGRGIVAVQGDRILIREDGSRQQTEQSYPVRILDPGLWHEYTIVAQGNRLEHRIDGQVTVVVEDDDREHAAREGVIALQLHPGPAYVTLCRSVQLTPLE